MPLDRKKMYADVAEGIISLMESGVAPWSRPWIVRGRNDPSLPRNGSSDRAYSGFNSLYLSHLMRVNGWSDPRFFTKTNMDSFGGRILKGNEGTVVVYNKRVVKEVEGEDKPKVFYLMRYWKVWNAAQISGVPERVIADPVEPFVHDGSFPVADRVVDEYCESQKVDVRYGGDRAFYSPHDDYIGMPDVSQFELLEKFYSVLFHEIIHSSGHSSRQDRLSKGGFGDDSYAKEELVAEFGASFLCVNTGVPLVESCSAAYVKSWADRCREDPALLVTAVNAAGRAADFVLDCCDVEVGDYAVV